MKQVKQIIEFILVVASCFFRKRKQQKVHPYVPEDPYPPGSCNGRKGDCPGCPGCNCNTQSAPVTNTPAPPGNTATSGQGYQPVSASEKQRSRRHTPFLRRRKPAWWCLLAVAGTVTCISCGLGSNIAGTGFTYIKMFARRT
jgi:hypothetical protein